MIIEIFSAANEYIRDSADSTRPQWFWYEKEDGIIKHDGI